MYQLRHSYLLQVLVGVVALSLASCPSFTSAEPLNIGVILPLTGAASGNTRFGSDGIEFASAVPQVASSLRLFIEDYGSEPARAVTAYKKLTTINNVRVVLVFGSPAAMVLKPLVERDRNVMLAIATAQGLTAVDGNSFRLVASSVEESKFIAAQWFTESGLTDPGASLAIVHVEDDYGESYLRGLKSSLSARSADSLHVAGFLPKEVDFRTILHRLRVQKPKVVLFAAFAQPAGLFLRQARELNLELKVICPLACYNPDLFTVGQGAEEGLIVTTLANPQDQKLVEQFRARFKYDGNFMSWGFYDGLTILAELASPCAGEPEPGLCLKKLLRRSEGFATSRGRLAFDQRGEMPFEIIASTVRNGEFR